MEAQQFVCRGHGANASIERGYKIGHRSAPLPGVGNKSTNGRECVLDAMVELGQQGALLFLHSFALGYVNADADDSVRASRSVIRNETARLDPSHLATGTNDTILYAIFAPVHIERLAAKLVYLLYVVWVHGSQAFAACDLSNALWEAVDGCITFRDLHDLRVGIICVTANKSRLSRQCELYIAFRQNLRCLFAFGHIDIGADHLYGSPGAIVRDENARFDPPFLAVRSNNAKF